MVTRSQADRSSGAADPTGAPTSRGPAASTSRAPAASASVTPAVQAGPEAELAGSVQPPGTGTAGEHGGPDTTIASASLDVLRVGVLVLDRSDRPVLVNPSAREMGLVRTGRLGDDVHTIVRTLAGQVRRTGIRREVELDLPRSRNVVNGTREPLGLHLRAVALTGGHVAVEAADVTEAHRVARVRRDFVANVSHELKTPVGALHLLAEALLDATEETGGDPAASRRFAERIRHESSRLGRLVSELLELSRLQGAEPLPEPEPVSVDRVVAEVIDRTRTPATAKGIHIGVSGVRGLTVYGNESQLATAVVNLVENAIAYSSEGTQVTITTAGGPEAVAITVRDQGIGIEPRDLNRIFERFYRADRARSRATGGTGLGLAIVKHIATNHAGRVDVASTVGVGSAFTLRLPARPPEDVLPLPEAMTIHDEHHAGDDFGDEPGESGRNADAH